MKYIDDDEPAPGTVAYWRRIAGGTVYMRETDDPEAVLTKIAETCVAIEARGEVACIWHASAEAFGYLDRCHCMPCSKKRGDL